MADKLIKNENYIMLQGWMINELHLKGNELLIYALIYGFTQIEGQKFTGSLQYLADWTNSTKQGVAKNVKNLVDKGLIVKETRKFNGVLFCEYSAVLVDGIQLSCIGGIQQSCTNNIDINNIVNNKNNITSNITKRTQFVKPTLEEVKAFVLENNLLVDADYWYKYYETYDWKVGSHKMKDWKWTLKNWDRREREKQPRGRMPVDKDPEVTKKNQSITVGFTVMGDDGQLMDVE